MIGGHYEGNFYKENLNKILILDSDRVRYRKLVLHHRDYYSFVYCQNPCKNSLTGESPRDRFFHDEL
ncbi:MAG: hypothetical protein AAF378_24910 [Cyanobacteria bacterium P01_A01_bin.84]